MHLERTSPYGGSKYRGNEVDGKIKLNKRYRAKMLTPLRLITPLSILQLLPRLYKPIHQRITNTQANTLPGGYHSPTHDNHESSRENPNPHIPTNPKHKTHTTSPPQPAKSTSPTPTPPIPLSPNPRPPNQHSSSSAATAPTPECTPTTKQNTPPPNAPLPRPRSARSWKFG